MARELAFDVSQRCRHTHKCKLQLDKIKIRSDELSDREAVLEQERRALQATCVHVHIHACKHALCMAHARCAPRIWTRPKRRSIRARAGFSYARSATARSRKGKPRQRSDVMPSRMRRIPAGGSLAGNEN